MSKKTKFTSGELEIFDESVVDSQGNLIVEVIGTGTSWSEDEANAHLFKTAPKLYEMIENDIEELELRLPHLHKRSQEYEKVIDEIYQKESLLAEARGEL